MKKKLLALLLAVAMVVTLVPAFFASAAIPAEAVEDEQPAGGAGEVPGDDTPTKPSALLDQLLADDSGYPTTTPEKPEGIGGFVVKKSGVQVGEACATEAAANEAMALAIAADEAEVGTTERTRYALGTYNAQLYQVLDADDVPDCAFDTVEEANEYIGSFPGYKLNVLPGHQQLKRDGEHFGWYDTVELANAAIAVAAEEAITNANVAALYSIASLVPNFEVDDADGAVIGYYGTLAEADAALRDGCVLKFLGDVEADATYTWGENRPGKYKASATGDYAAGATGTNISYTIDGQGFKYYYNQRTTDAYAWAFGAASCDDTILIKNVTLISGSGGISAGITGIGMNVYIHNVRMYVNDMYSMVDNTYPDATANARTYPGIFNSTGATTLYLTGKDTVVYSCKGPAVQNHGIMLIYDGYYYAARNDRTLLASGNDETNGARKVMVYGGTFVNDWLTAARPEGGGVLWIMGGKFIETGRQTTTGRSGTDSNAAALRLGTGSANGYAYVVGGEFWVNDTLDNGTATNCAVRLVNANCYGFFANAKFYYGKSGQNITGSTLNISSFSRNTAEAQGTYTVDVPSLGATDNKFTVTASYTNTIEPMYKTEEAMLAAGADAAIKDAEGKIVMGITFTTAAPSNTIFATTSKAAAIGYRNTIPYIFGYSFNLIPAFGTWELLKDRYINFTDGNNNYAQMFMQTGMCPVTIDGNGHMLTYNNKGYYFNYSSSGAPTWKDITVINPTGRLFQFGNANRTEVANWTFENATVIAGEGSACYLGTNGTMNLTGNTVFEITKDKNRNDAVIQVLGGSTLNLYDNATVVAHNSEYAFGGMSRRDAGNASYSFFGGKFFTRERVDCAINLYGNSAVVAEMGAVRFTANWSATGNPAANFIFHVEDDAAVKLNTNGALTDEVILDAVANNFENTKLPLFTEAKNLAVLDASDNVAKDELENELVYADFNEAIASGNVVNGTALKLLGDVYVYDVQDLTVDAMKDVKITVDGNGHKIVSVNRADFYDADKTSDAARLGMFKTVAEGAEIVFNNVDVYGCTLIAFHDNGTVTINGGDWKSGANPPMFSFREKAGTLNINGGDFVNLYGPTCGMLSADGGYLNITAGNFGNDYNNNLFYDINGGGEIVITGGTFWKGGTSRMMKFTGKTNITIKGDAKLTCVDNSDVLAVGTPYDGKIVLGDETNATEFRSTNGRAVCTDSGKTDITVNGGKYFAYSYVFQLDATGTAVFNGGEFHGNYGSAAFVCDTAISANHTNVTINGGYYDCAGTSVARVLSGAVSASTGGTITKEADASLTINGGTFVLLPNYCKWDEAQAVIRCGGGSTYGTVTINGGTFIDNNGGSRSVIHTVNTCSTLILNAGCFMSLDIGRQEMFVLSSGSVTSKNAHTINGKVTAENFSFANYSQGEITYKPLYAPEGTYVYWTVGGASIPEGAVKASAVNDAEVAIIEAEAVADEAVATAVETLVEEEIVLTAAPAVETVETETGANFFSVIAVWFRNLCATVADILKLGCCVFF